MKHLFGQFNPHEKYPAMNMKLILLKMEEFNFLLNSSLISENQHPVLLKTDQNKKIVPLMIPILSVLTEFTGGPCQDNIDSIKNNHLKFNFYPI